MCTALIKNLKWEEKESVSRSMAGHTWASGVTQQGHQAQSLLPPLQISQNALLKHPAREWALPNTKSGVDVKQAGWRASAERHAERHRPLIYVPQLVPQSARV